MKIKVVFMLLALTLTVNAIDEKGVRFYVKKYLEKKTHSPVENIETLSSYPIAGTHGWTVHFLSMKIKMKMGKIYRKRLHNQVVFTKGNKIAFSLKNSKNQNYAKILKPKVPQSAYDDEHLLIGNPNATHRLLVMSDPSCPYCQEIIPPLIDAVQAHPNLFALYNYHIPLSRIHPASRTIAKVMYILQKRGDIKNFRKLYHLVVDPRETRVDRILFAIKKRTGLSFTEQEISTAEIIDALDEDRKMKRRLMVTGTPTIFVDDVWDPSRFLYKRYLSRGRR
jgi:protein-disulfide isomerase